MDTRGRTKGALGAVGGTSQGGMSMKQVTLVMLTIQNSALILIMHYSRIMPPVGGHRYFTSTAVFLNEVIKLAISLSAALYDLSKTMPNSTPVTSLFGELFAQVFTGDSWKLAVPAMLYTLQNSLQYVAISNLDAATFQVTYQLKIMATAVFSVALLGRKLDAQKWFSLVLLMAGVAIVQIPNSANGRITLKDLREDSSGWQLSRSIEEMRDLGNIAAGQLLGKRSATYEGIEQDFAMHNPQMNTSIGLAAVIIACVLSGLAGVYFEKVLKESPNNISVWIRNVQLSSYSLFPALFIGVVFKDGADISKHGFFIGYNWVVWTAISFQAVGGVMVSLVVNYADNIAKNFATSISILLSFLISIFCFDLTVSFTYVIGTAVVIGATYLYNAPDGQSRPLPVPTENYEKSTTGQDGGYFDLEKTSTATLETPLRYHQATTSSRPSTPMFERRHVSAKISDPRVLKRDE